MPWACVVERCAHGPFSTKDGLRSHVKLIHGGVRLSASQLDAIDYRHCPGCGRLGARSRKCSACNPRAHPAAAEPVQPEVPLQAAHAPVEQPAPPAVEPAAQPAAPQQPGQQAPAAQQPDPAEQPNFPNDLLVYPRVPRTAVPAFAELCTAKAKAAVAAATRGDDAECTQHLHTFLSVPARTCSDLNGGRGAGRRALAKVQLVAEGQLDQVPLQGSQFPQRQRSADQQEARRITRELEAHQIRRATGALDSGKQTEWSADLPQRAAALFPVQPPPQLPEAPADAVPVTVTAEEVLEQLYACPSTSAPGPSRQTFNHLRAWVDAGEDHATQCAELLEAIANGLIPSTSVLLDGRLVMIDKPSGGLRPIAVGECLLRLLDKILMKQCKGVWQSFAPVQLGVSIAGGAQSIGQAVGAALRANPRHVAVNTDMANAFGTVDLTCLLQDVADEAPQLLTYTAFKYKQPTRLWLANAPPGTPPQLSMSIRQGDGLGPAYYGCFSVKPLRAVAQAHPDAPPIAYLDDNTLVGEPEAAIAATRSLLAACAPRGQVPRLHKCEVTGSDPALVEQTAAALQFTARPEGMLSAGTPLGTDAFKEQHCLGVADRACALIDKLMSLPVSLQGKLLLLRKSLQLKVAHLPRTVHWHQCEAAVQRLQSKVCEAVQRLLHISDEQLTERVRAQIFSPLRLGGLGFHDTCVEVGIAAYVSAAAKAQGSLRDAAACYQPFTGGHNAELRDMWHALHDALPRLWPEEHRDVAAALQHRALELAQQAVGHRVADDAFQQLLGGCDVDTAEGRAAAARLRSCACREAAAYLDAFPATPLKLSDADLRMGLRLHLGVLRLPVAAVGTRCSCGHRLTVLDATHAMACPKASGPVESRHHHVVDVWCQAGRRAALDTCREPRLRTLRERARARAVLVPESAKSRGDILIPHQAGLEVIDVSITDPTAASYVDAAAAADGAAAAARDVVKAAEYLGDVNAGVYGFTAATQEVFGRLGHGGWNLLNSMAEHASEQGRVDKERFKHNTLLHLSVALCRGNCWVLKAGLHELAKAAGRRFVRGLYHPTADLAA